MKGYWVSLYTKIENQDNLKKYAATVTPIIKCYGGIPLVRGRKNIRGRKNYLRKVKLKRID